MSVPPPPAPISIPSAPLLCFSSSAPQWRSRLGPTSIPSGWPPRSVVACGICADAGESLMPSTSPFCFLSRFLFFTSDPPAEKNRKLRAVEPLGVSLLFFFFLFFLFFVLFL